MIKIVKTKRKTKRRILYHFVSLIIFYIIDIKYNFVRSIILSIINSENRGILLIFKKWCSNEITHWLYFMPNYPIVIQNLWDPFLQRSVLKRNISSLSIPSSYEKNIRRTNVSNEIPKVCSMRGTSLAHVIREIKGKHFIVNVSREFNSPESF